MSERSWFFASQGQQHGPCPEHQLRELIATGTVTADTLVWTEGMANWQRAGDIPGLLTAGAGPPAMAQPGGALVATGGHDGDPLSIDFGIWDFTWRTLVLSFGVALIIPAPWVITMYAQWMMSCTRVPSRPNLSFTGRPATLMWFFAAIVLVFVVALIEPRLVNLVVEGVQLLLYWLLIRWVIANIGSNGQPLGLRFSGSFWGYAGWSLLMGLSVVTIIGWAWVYTAQIRWMGRHVEGTRRAIVFNATGLEFLWRAIVTVIACMFVIPIPWVMRWLIRWQVSQIALVERGAVANA